MLSNVERAGLIVRYEPWTTPEELYRHDQLERAVVLARERALAAYLVAAAKQKEDRPWS
jgi:hypothetical protein